jgi:hypothetical protein
VTVSGTAATITVSLSSGDHKVRALYTPNVNDDIEFRVS